MKRICLLDNPISGSHAHTARVKTLQGRMENQGFRVSYEPLTSFEQTRQIVDRQIETGCDIFVVSGGDGTIRSVAQHLTGTDIPLLIFPSGNENLLAAQMGLVPDPDRAMEILLQGKCRYIDVAKINDLICIAIAGVGVDAAIVHHVHRHRKGHISIFDYVWPTIKTFFSYRHKMIEVRMDGRDVHRGKALAFIGNIPRYGGGFKIFHEAVCDDGLLDVVIFRCGHIFQLLYLFILALTGKTTGSSLVRHFKGKDIVIETPCDGMKTQIDGEPGPDMPLTIRVVPKALCLLVP